MNDNDKIPFFQLLVGASEIIGKDLSKHGMKLYWELLKKYDYPDVARAFNAHAANPDVGQFMPKPADIIKFIEGSSETRALQAWSKVSKAIGSVGPYQSVVYDDLIIHLVVRDMGGWIQLCTITDDELPFRAREFEKRYAGFTQNPPDKYPNRLIGIAEGANSVIGHEIESPILIGDHSKAMAILENGSTDNQLPIKKASEYLAERIGQKQLDSVDPKQIS